MLELILVVLMEGIVLSFLLLLTCVIGIANGPVGLVVLYENDVQERVVKLGLTTKAEIRKSFIISSIAMFAPSLILVPLMVYGLNGADGFLEGFVQMTAIYLIMGLFDRFFIDMYWVGHTKAWEIPGTEDLKPYIPKKICIGKWIGTLVIFPAIAAIISWIIALI